jgi:acyl-CoA thioester hydrolase
MGAFEYRLQTRFVDVDGFGHVNNAVFLSYLENAREALYRRTGFVDQVGDDKFILVSHQEIEYRAPLQFDGEPVLVEVWVGRIGRSSFDLSYRVSSSDGATVYALAVTGMVVTSRGTGRPVPMDDSHRAVLQEWADEPVRLRVHGGS